MVRRIPERGRQVRCRDRFDGQTEWLNEHLGLHQPESTYRNMGEIELPIIDTGENGFFTKGEFETIPAFGQMNIITPSEMAHEVAMKIQVGRTGEYIMDATDQ